MSSQDTKAPPDAERRPQGTGTGNVLNLDATTVAQPSDNRPRLTGCPAGCPLDHHECGVGQDVTLPTCEGRCLSFGVPEQRRIAELHGACPCTLEAAS